MANFLNPIPEEDQIAALLENVQPQPRPNLRARVANATWASGAEILRGAEIVRGNPKGKPFLPAWGSRRRIAFTSLAVLSVLIVFLVVPPFNGIAQRVANFFNRADNDTLPIVLTTQPPSQSGSVHPTFPLSVSEAATQAGFTVQQPGWLPEGFQLNGAAYDTERQAVVSDYHSPIPGKFLRLTQSQTAENRLDVSSIGVSAEVQTLDIDTQSEEIVSGEYVAGAWHIPSVLDHLQTGQPDLTATMQANWDPNAKVHMLRWLSNGFLYEIIHADQTLDTLSAEMLVKIAESMK